MPKLPKGMFRRSGRPGWYIRLFRGGSEKWVSLGTDFNAACDQARMLSAGVPVSRKSAGTVAEAAQCWLDSYIRTQRDPKGQALVAQRVRDYFDPYLGGMDLERVSKEDVRGFRLWLQGTTTLSASTVGHVLSDLRCLLHWCADTERLDSSPFPRRVMPRLQEQPPKRLTDEQAAQLAALQDPHGFVCRLALGTGLRWGELTRAQASDVKRFRGQGEQVDQWFVEVSNTKSKRVRRVPLSPELVREIRQKVGRLVPYATLSPGSFATAVRKLTGIEDFHVHRMRHTFGCQWLERGGSLAALQQVLGHASIVTTQRYARLTDEAVMREAGRLACRR